MNPDVRRAGDGRQAPHPAALRSASATSGEGRAPHPAALRRAAEAGAPATGPLSKSAESAAVAEQEPKGGRDSR